MTVQEAIDDIRECIQPVVGGISLEMAIDALKEKLNEEEPKTFCDTCGHQYSDICGGCESLDGVPVKHTEKGAKMSEDCPRCRYNSTEENCRGCFEGSNFRPKQTNADIIRSLTDEELRNFLYAIAIKEDCLHESCKSSDCRTCILEWLKQEVEG